MGIIDKLSFFHYNIGFFPFKEASYLNDHQIIWMQHNYKDRFFADPFILDLTDKYILVLVEEFLYNEWKGRISLLYVNRETYKLEKIKVLLDLKTHLSFPFIHRVQDETYIIPENSKSGSLIIYKYIDETLIPIKEIINEPIIDPVLINIDNKHLIFGSILNKNENKDLYVWKSDSLLGKYERSKEPIIIDNPNCSRRGGGFFTINNNMYSAVQKCSSSYGEALNICKVNYCSENELSEEIIKTIYPDTEYPSGIHTFNIYKEMCVVDGLKYLFSPLKKTITALKRNYNKK